jgi:hypothetical protein
MKKSNPLICIEIAPDPQLSRTYVTILKHKGVEVDSWGISDNIGREEERVFKEVKKLIKRLKRGTF